MSALITFRELTSSGQPTGPTFYLEFDALSIEEHRRTANVTQYPVETGAILSDHYQPQPLEITLSGVVTNTPSGAALGLDGMTNAAAGPPMSKRTLVLATKPDPRRVGGAGIPRPISTTVLPSRRLVRANVERGSMFIPRRATVLQVAGTGSSSDANRITVFAEVLDWLISTRLSVAVVMQDGTEHADMMIINQTTPRSAGAGDSVRVTIDLQQVVRADAAVTTAGAAERDNVGHQPAKKKGKRNPKPTEKYTPEGASYDFLTATLGDESTESLSPLGPPLPPLL